MNKQFLCCVAVGVSFLVSFSSVWASQSEKDEWVTMDEPSFQKLLVDYEANPTLLAEDRNLIKQLSGEQLTRAIEYLGLDHFTYLHPVILRPNQYPQIDGRAIDSLSVQAVRGGKMIPIPFQIDEIDEQGWVFTGEDAPYDLLGEAGVYDENDELIFMFRDTGRLRYNELTMAKPPGDGQIIKEMVLKDAQGKKRYAYLMKNSTARNTADYVLFDIDTGVAQTVFYNFKTKPDNFLVFEDFKANVGDQQNHRIVDSILVDVSTNVFTKWSPRISLNNFDNLQAQPVASKDGQVRAATLIKLWVVIAKVPVFRIVAQLNVWDQGLGLPIRINIPGAEILTGFLVDPLIDIAIDFNELTGAHVNSAISPDPDGFGVVDGMMSDFEKNSQITLKDNWMWLESGHGWDVFFQLDTPPDLDVGVSMFYQDDPSLVYKNEAFAGAWPRVGYRIDRLPKEELNIDIDVQFWFPDTVGLAGPASFNEAMSSVPKLVIRDYRPDQRVAEVQ